MENRFKIYRSSAGSGKTFTLTKEYIKLALVNPQLGEKGFNPHYFRHILAVTFTNDAAQEMKSRILEELSAFAKLGKGQSHPMLESILEEIREEYDFSLEKEILIQRAARVHQHILHNYSNFAISTIDAFNKRIVQAFSRDLDVQHNFEISFDNDALLDEAIARLFSQIGEYGDYFLTDTLKSFTLREAQKERSWHIEQLIKTFSNNLFQENRWQYLEQIAHLTDQDFKEIKNQLYSYLADNEQFIKEKGSEALRLISEAGLTAKAFSQSTRGIFGYFQKHHKPKDENFLALFFESSGGNSYVQKTIFENKWLPSKPTEAQKQGVESIKAALETLYHELEAAKNEHREEYIVAHSMVRHIYQLTVLRHLQDFIKGIKEEKNQVHISEFNTKINQVVEYEPVPYIYERIGERYKHILIDEFQDTSQMQWHNLIPLLANGLSYGLLNMLVGDAKQAIYRWRGGEPEQIVKLPAVPTAKKNSPIQEHASVFAEQQNPQNLQKNWRSKANIIAFNNAFFSQTRDAFGEVFPDVQDFYAEIEQQANAQTGGHVSIDFLKSKGDDYREETFEKLLQLVHHLHEVKNYQKSDIVVLVRRNDDGAYLAERFMAENIAVISSESLLLRASPSIQFIVNFMQLLQNPSHATLKFHLIKFLLKNKPPKAEGVVYAESEQLSNAADVANQPDLESFVSFLEAVFHIELDTERLQYLSLYEIAEELLRCFELQQNAKEQTYIQKFLDVLMNFGQKHSNNLLDFLEYWERKKNSLSVSSPSSGDAIRIMTLHKSKGLEFPVVILAFADWSLQPTGGGKSPQIWLNWESKITPKLKTIILPLRKELRNTGFRPQYLAEMQASFIDGLNMLYVALTRPKNELHIFAKAPTNRKGEVTLPSDLTDIGHVNVLLAYYLVHLAKMSEELQENYVLCQDQSPNETSQNTDKEPVSSFLLEKFLSTHPRDKIKVRQNNLKHGESNLTLSDVYASQKLSKLMRLALEKITYRQDIETAAYELVQQGLATAKECETLTLRLHELLNVPKLKPFFEEDSSLDIFTEKEILLQNQKWAAKISRLLLQGDKAIAINYQLDASQLEKHQRSMRFCAQALKQMNFKDVETILVYLDSLEVV